MPPVYYQQDPDDLLDYKFDFAALTNGTGDSDWLASGETITAKTVTADPVGITISSSSITDSATSVTVWLTSGTSGTTYSITCHITTSDGREVDQTIYVTVLETTAIATTTAESVYDPYEAMGDYGNCAVPLHRYAQIIGYDEAMFWGVHYDGQEELACDSYWNESDRMQIALALAEAQWDIERIIGYPLCPTWVTGEWTDGDGSGRWTDSQEYTGRQITRYPLVIAAGVKATTTLASGSSVNCTDDPALVGPIATSLTSTAEIQVFHTGTTRRIYPSSMTISGGNLYIYIPRCRLVKTSYLSKTAIDYTNLSYFAVTVDVKRVYNDPSTNAVLVAPHVCSLACASDGCSLYTQDACMVFTNTRLGFVKVSPATYSAGSWVAGGSGVCNRSYTAVRMNYYCGMKTLSPDAEMAIVRLAHNKVPASLCGCDTYIDMWRRDREEPRGTPTRMLQNAPFGTSAGARYAYNVALRLKMFRGNSAH